MPPSRNPANARAKMPLAAALLILVTLTTVAGPAQAEKQDEPSHAAQVEEGLQEKFDAVLGEVNAVLGALLFTNIAGDLFQVDVYEKGKVVVGEDGKPKKRIVEVPFVVALLAFGGIFFTITYRFVNVFGFRHALEIIRGKYDHDDHEGEVSHFRALTSALSATVGLGNIAGVAIAIQLGGPGAVFWMIVAALFGMSTKFSSCTLAQLYRKKNADGTVSGGAMYYLDLGLKERGGALAHIGKALAVLYAFMIMAGAMGGGNMFQANQSFEAFSTSFDVSPDYSWVFGLIMAGLVGAVILGGIRRIGAATSRIVPAMVALYLGASIIVILVNLSEVPHAFSLIFERAFTNNAAYGGFMGVLVWGVQRASFSNEAGLGSSAIAHAAAKTDEPVREGLVAMLEPFIDTVIVCTMTALVVIVSGAWQDPNIPQSAGVALTTGAFSTVLPWFPKVLSICVILFAYSTMISWCYYGERGWIYLMDHFGLGLKTLPVFRVVFVCFVFIGSIANLGQVLTFSDILILCMAMPNILGSMLLVPQLRARVFDYFERMKQIERSAASAQ